MGTKSINFIITNIEAIVLPKSGRDEYKDIKNDYLRLRVTAKGVKSYSVYKRLKGKNPVRVTFGKFPSLPPEAAKKQARLIVADIEQGINPNTMRRKNAIEAMTLNTAFDEYIHARNLRPKTVAGYDSVFKCHLFNLHDKRLKEISRSDINKTFKRISSEAQANLSMRLIRAIFNFAKEEYLDEHDLPIFTDNPTAILSHRRSWHRIEPRNTHVRSNQLEKFAQSLAIVRNNSTESENAPAITDALLFALLTGLRRKEILNLKWNNIYLESEYFTIPDQIAKNGKELELPITNYLKQIFSWRYLNKKSEFVFGASNHTGQIKEPKKTVNKVVQLSEAKCQFHDLRRTFATTAEHLDLSIYKRRRLMNHLPRRDDMTEQYTVLTSETLKSAAEKIQDTIANNIGWFPYYN